MPKWTVSIVLWSFFVTAIGFAFLPWLLEPDYSDVIAEAIESSPFPQQFERLFPDSEHTVERMKHRFPSGEFRTMDHWFSRACLYQRYTIEMSFPFRTSEIGLIEPVADPKIFFCELKEARVNSDGSIWSRTGDTGCISVDDWNSLVESNGNLSALGHTIIRDSPIENFEIWSRR